MPEKDASELADQREHEADRMEQKTAQLQGDVDDVRHDWQQKRATESVPGAPPPEDSEDDDSEDDDTDDDDTDDDDTASEASSRSETDDEGE